MQSQGHQSFVTALAYHPQGTALASASLDDQIRVWNLQTGRSKALVSERCESMVSDSRVLRIDISGATHMFWETICRLHACKCLIRSSLKTRCTLPKESTELRSKLFGVQRRWFHFSFWISDGATYHCFLENGCARGFMDSFSICAGVAALVSKCFIT